jgi:hypothetical protein
MTFPMGRNAAPPFLHLSEAHRSALHHQCDIAATQGTGVILAAVDVASNSICEGHGAQVALSAGVFGSPLRMNAPMLAITALDNATRPGWLASQTRSGLASVTGRCRGAGIF